MKMGSEYKIIRVQNGFVISFKGAFETVYIANTFKEAVDLVNEASEKSV